MSNYDELWRALTVDAQDGLLVSALKQWVGDVSERLNAHSYPLHEDFDHDTKLEESLLFVLRDCMTAEQWDEFMGSDKPSCPQCDDEEFLVELEALNDAGEVCVTVELDGDTPDVMRLTAEIEGEGRGVQDVLKTVISYVAAEKDGMDEAATLALAAKWADRSIVGVAWTMGCLRKAVSEIRCD